MIDYPNRELENASSSTHAHPKTFSPSNIVSNFLFFSFSSILSFSRIPSPFDMCVSMCLVINLFRAVRCSLLVQLGVMLSEMVSA